MNMATSPEELAGLRAHANQLQTEWRSIRAAAPETRLEAEREVEAEALRNEIAHLQGVVVQEVRSAGGSTEDALAAMQRAAEVEKNVTEAHTKVAVDKEVEVSGGDSGFVSSSSTRSVGPALPSNPPNQPVDSGESSSPHLIVDDNPNSEMEFEGNEANDETDEEGSR